MLFRSLKAEPGLAERLVEAATARLRDRFDREDMLDAYAAVLREAAR